MATLSTLRQILSSYPGVEKYCQIKVVNKKFNNTMWKYPAGEELMKMSGWAIEGDHISLKDDSYIQTVAQLFIRYTLPNKQLKTEIEILQLHTTNVASTNSIVILTCVNSQWSIEVKCLTPFIWEIL